MATRTAEVEAAKVGNENNIEHITEEDDIVHLTLPDITESAVDHPRGIPTVKFLEDITTYVESFSPKRVTAELLIGAYTQLHTKYKLSESSLLRKRKFRPFRFLPIFNHCDAFYNVD